MSDRRPQEAIYTVDGGSELHPASDVARGIPPPDRYGGQPGVVDDVDAARAQECALLAMLLAWAPDEATLRRIANLRGDATPLGRAHAALAIAMWERPAGYS